MLNKKVSIVIVNWNGAQFLKKCLSSIFKQKYKNIEVILVDNGSTDNSVSFIKKNFPDTKIVINNTNLGFAEANNIGYDQSRGDYVLFLNNDTEVTNSFLVELVKVLESDAKIGGVQSKLLLMDDPRYLDSVGAFLTNTGFLYHYGIAKKNTHKYNHKIPVFSAKGACMIFKKKVLEDIKVDGDIFDKAYFAYFEETDMCFRVWLAGYSIVFAPNSKIYHKMGGTSSNMNNGFIQYHSFKNRICTYIKNFSTTQFMTILPVHVVLIEIFALISLLSLNFSMFLVVQKALWWNVRHILPILKKRKYIHRKIKKVNLIEINGYIYRKVSLDYYYYLFLGNLKEYKD